MPSVQLLDPLERAERRSDGALGIVIPRQRRAEHGHHGIADELLHDPAEPLDPVAELVEVETVQRANVFGIGAVGTSR